MGGGERSGDVGGGGRIEIMVKVTIVVEVNRVEVGMR